MYTYSSLLVLECIEDGARSREFIENNIAIYLPTTNQLKSWIEAGSCSVDWLDKFDRSSRSSLVSMPRSRNLSNFNFANCFK